MPIYYAKPHVCCTCGKQFYPAVMHVYKKTWKKKVYYACKPSCYEAMLKAIDDARRIQSHGEGVNKLIDKNGPDVL